MKKQTIVFIACAVYDAELAAPPYCRIVHTDVYEYVERMMWKCVNSRTKINGSDGNCSYMPHSAQRDTMCIWRGKSILSRPTNLLRTHSDFIIK